MRAFLSIIICVMLASPPVASAMGLLTKSEGQAAWEALQGRVLQALGGSCGLVSQPTERVGAASMAGANRGKLPVNKVVAVKLQAMEKIRYAVGPEKKQEKAQDAGGLLALTAPATGTYVLGTVSHAWIDLVDQEQNSFARAKHYEWVDFCGRRMKAGIFELRAGARYWIQVSASPGPVLDLFLAGPLN